LEKSELLVYYPTFLFKAHRISPLNLALTKTIQYPFFGTRLICGAYAKSLFYLDNQESPEFHYSMRLAIAAIQYRKGEIEEAIRECLNVDQALNYMLRRVHLKNLKF